MKSLMNIKFLAIIAFMILGHDVDAQSYQVSSQAELDALANQPMSSNSLVALANDTTLPLSEQITDISVLAGKDSLRTLSVIDCPSLNYDVVSGVYISFLSITHSEISDNLEFIEQWPFLTKIACSELQGVQDVDLNLQLDNLNLFLINETESLQSVKITLNNQSETSLNMEFQLNPSLNLIEVYNTHGVCRSIKLVENHDLDSLYIDYVEPLFMGMADFNQSFSTIRGFHNIDKCMMEFRYNYSMADLCVLQPGYQNFVAEASQSIIDQMVFLQNGPNASSLDDVLNYDCSYLASVDELGHSDFTVYPNPSSGVVNLPADLRGQIQILNMTGQVVYQGQVEATIDLSVLPSGIYLVQIENEKDRLSSKIIIE